MGAGPSGFLSAQFLSRQKYHVSLGEFVLSVSHDKRKKEDAVSALSDLFVESLSKTLTSQIWVHEYLNRILHHGMSPALVADQPQGLIQKGITSSRPRKYILARIIFLVLMTSALAFASTIYHYEKTVQSSREKGRSTVALVESSSSSTPLVQQEKETKATQEVRALIKAAEAPGEPTEIPRPIVAAKADWHVDWEKAQSDVYWIKTDTDARARAAAKNTNKNKHQTDIDARDRAAAEAIARAKAEANEEKETLEIAEALAESRDKAETEATRARGEAEEKKRKEREILEKNRAETAARLVRAAASLHKKARGEAQANAEAEVKIQTGLEAADRVAEEARAASVIKRGAIRRFIVERLVAVTPPESTTANDKFSRSKGPIRGFLKHVLVKNKTIEKQR
jgi:hypothetical protein